MTHQATLSPRQRKAIQALLTCPTVAEAAEKAGIVRQTVYKWLGDDTFRAALADAQAQALDGVLHRVIAETTAALDTLAALHKNVETAEAQRVAAARGILALLPDLRRPDAPTIDPLQVAREALFSAQWTALRTMLLDTLAAYPDARAALAEALTHGNGA